MLLAAEEGKLFKADIDWNRSVSSQIDLLQHHRDQK